jgi:hypothetical protein
MKTALCLVFVLLSAGLLLAADIAYDISKFHPTDLLEYSLSAAFNNISGYDYQQSDDNSFSLNNSVSLSGGINKQRRDYLWYLNSDNRINYYNLREKYIDEDIAFDNKRLSHSYTASVSAGYTRYWHALFLGGTASVYFIPSENEYKTEHDTGDYTDKSSNLYWQTGFSVPIGMGRLYQCQEAYLAWYIYRELDKNNCLARQYEAADVDALAKQLFELRTMYGIDPDTLYRKKAALLLDYFQASAFIADNAQSKALAILFQMWGSSNRIRLTGTQIKIIPSTNMSNYHQHDNNYYPGGNNHSSSTGYEAKNMVEIYFNYERPIRNVFQLRSQLYVQQGWLDEFGRSSNFESNRTNWTPYSHFDASGIFSWYPDYRSELAFGLNANFKYKNLNDNDPALTVTRSQTPKPNPKSKAVYNKTLPKEQMFDLDIALIYSRSLNNRTAASISLTYEQYHYKEQGNPVEQDKDVSLNASVSYRLF